MKNKIIKIVLYIVGIFCIAYPIYSRFLAYKNQTESIYDYKKEIIAMQQEELEEKRKKAEEFNQNNSNETSVIDTDSIVEKTEEETSTYNFLDLGEMMGYISIPKISIELPIYEGVTVNNLTKGVAHMENTSLPNGNLGTHAVLAGHTGISQAEIFDNISKLTEGDEFFVTFYGVTTKYKVIRESVVLPDETRDLKIEPDRCLVTLVTCTPKSVNTHRLLVTGEKVEEIIDQVQEEPVQEEVQVIQKKSNIELLKDFVSRNSTLFIIILLIIILLVILTTLNKIANKRRKENEKKHQ